MIVNVGLAFLAGLASFLSPCVFALVPAYIGYLGGRSAASAQDGKPKRLTTFAHGLAFVLGFSVVFVVLGALGSAIGGILTDFQYILAKVGGVLIIFFGLHMAGVLHLSFLDIDLRPQSTTHQGRSYLSSALMGVFFSAGWSPCVGPVLGTIMTVVINEGSIGFGIQMLSAYSAGLAIPFLIAALGVGWVTFILRRYQKVLHIIQLAMGWVMVILGIMLFLGIFQNLARFGIFVDFGL